MSVYIGRFGAAVRALVPPMAGTAVRRASSASSAPRRAVGTGVRAMASHAAVMVDDHRPHPVVSIPKFKENSIAELNLELDSKDTWARVMDTADQTSWDDDAVENDETGEDTWAMGGSQYNALALHKLKGGTRNEHDALLRRGDGAVAEDSTLAENAVTLDSLMALYMVHFRKGEYEKALEVVGERHRVVAEAMRLQLEASPAERSLTTHVTTLTRSYLKIANSYLRLGQNETAIAATRSAEQVAKSWTAKFNEQNPSTNDECRLLDDILINQYYCYKSLGQMETAERAARHVVALRERRLGVDHPAVANVMEVLAENLEAQGRVVEAEMAYRRVIESRKKEPRHPVESLTVVTITKLARLYVQNGKYKDARAYYRRAVKMRENFYGVTHPMVVETLGEYLHFLDNSGLEEDKEKAEKVRSRIEDLLAQAEASTVVNAKKKRGRRRRNLYTGAIGEHPLVNDASGNYAVELDTASKFEHSADEHSADEHDGVDN